MSGREEITDGTHAVVYCLVPRDLAAKLHEPLRKHFRDHPRIEVIVERRTGDRRKHEDRRGADVEGRAGRGERRRIRAPEGRRAGDRRADLIPIEAPSLPPKARVHAGRLAFLGRVAPPTEQAEDMDTAWLVARFQSGERDVFAALYMRYFDRVYSYLHVALNDPHAAEDLTQQVFTNVLQALPDYERRPGVVFRRWLFAIVRNEAVRELRKLRRGEVIEADALERRRRDFEATDETLPVLDWISDRDLVMFVERLPPVQRQVLVLRYMLDLSHRDIAAVLDRSVEDVRSLHSRAVRFLRARLTSLGRGADERRRIRMRGCVKQLPVMGARRWALRP